ncbi:MAG: FKBP-type peptidyl-prolyl cis-trans isomerase [Chitinophagaceae bacterium]|nr:FKBP-type peptidyl-prolyl cis-trans isomerase [Chitinophagaceae bacterium]
MKKLLSGIVIAFVLLQGCTKKNDTCSYTDSTLTAPKIEVDSLQAYLTKNSISATQNPAGFFYTITPAATGKAIVNLCSTLTVKYKGKFVNGSVFDSTATSTTAAFQLGQVIVGWQKGLPLIKSNEKITLYIPPTLGYGFTDVRDAGGHVVIPANSILIFDIELVDVN